MDNNIIKKNKFDKNNSLVNESLFTLANGYIGVRASFEEGVTESIPTSPAVFINGFYDLFDVSYGSKYHGYPNALQKMVAVTDIQAVNFKINQKPYLFDGNNISNFAQYLDLNSGELTRSYTLQIPEGELEFIFKKLVSAEHSEIFYQQITINPKLTKPILFEINVSLDNFNKKNVKAITDKRVARISDLDLNVLDEVSAQFEVNTIIKVSQTKRSNKSIIAGTMLNFESLDNLIVQKQDNNLTYEFELFNSTLCCSKTNVLWDDKLNQISYQLANEKLTFAIQNGYEFFVNANKNYWNKIWMENEVIFENKSLTQAYNFNFYQLISNTGKYKWTNIAAKGLTGEGYNGHYFWDTEVYVIPALVLSQPDLVKNLLMYRYEILPQAIARARELNHNLGALYPWRTINGQESSPYYPAGTAQYHINGDIAYGIVQYFLATNDYEFLLEYGCEMLLQTALFWITKVSYYNDQYHVNSVTGPDEYQILVDNDYYTNQIVKFNIHWALKVLDLVKTNNKSVYDALLKKVAISANHLVTLKAIEQKIIVLFDAHLNLNPQHNSFLSRQVIDLKTLAPFKPLVMKMHPLTINNMQISKQADVVLADYMFGNVKGATVMKNNYKFYNKVNTADSSLSECIYAIQAARLNIANLGVFTFKEVCNTDFLNLQKNTAGGLHIANMAGARMYVMYGMLGISFDSTHILSLKPLFIKEIGSYSVSFSYRGFKLKIVVTKTHFKITKDRQEALTINYLNQHYELKTELKVLFKED